MTTKEQIEAAPYYRVKNRVFREEWLAEEYKSERGATYIEPLYNAEALAQAHAAGVREGLIKAAKIFDEKAELLSEDADELGAAAAQEIRALIKE